MKIGDIVTIKNKSGMLQVRIEKELDLEATVLVKL